MICYWVSKVKLAFQSQYYRHSRSSFLLSCSHHSNNLRPPYPSQRAMAKIKLRIEPCRPKSLFSNIDKDLFAAFLEFVGTTFFLLFAFGGTQATAAQTSASPESSHNRVIQVYSISASFGLSLLVSAWVFFRVTGGLFNPNVAMSLFLAGALTPMRFVLYVGAELVGGIVAAAIIQALTSGPLFIKWVIRSAMCELDPESNGETLAALLWRQILIARKGCLWKCSRLQAFVWLF